MLPTRLAPEYIQSQLNEQNPDVHFGCVLFDVETKEDGRLVPVFKEGWASVEGAEPFRINSPSELDSAVLWWTNIGRDMLWLNNGLKYKKFKCSEFLGVDMTQVMLERKCFPPDFEGKTPKATQMFSEFFSRVMRSCIKNYGIRKFDKTFLYESVNKALLKSDNPLVNDLELAKALTVAFGSSKVDCTAWVDVNSRESEEEQKKVKKKLVFNRSALVRKVLGNCKVVPKGGWEFLSGVKIAAGMDQNAWLEKQKTPMLLRINYQGLKWKKAPEEKDAFIQYLWKTAQADKQRFWLTEQEAKYLANFFELEILGVYKAKELANFAGEDDLIDFGLLGGVSLTAEMLDWGYFLALLMKRRHPKEKTLSCVDPLGVWLKSALHFELFKSSWELTKKGFIVESFGEAEIVAFGEDFKSILQSFDVGLIDVND